MRDACLAVKGDLFSPWREDLRPEEDQLLRGYLSKESRMGVVELRKENKQTKKCCIHPQK